MGAMKDLLIQVYGGGDEAVEAATRLCGLQRWTPIGESQPRPYQTVLLSRPGNVWAAEYREPDRVDSLEGGPESPWWMIFKGPRWPTRDLSWAGYSDVEESDKWMPLPEAE